MATLTLRARFQRDTGKAIIAYLPGKNYGTPQDEQVLLATHTDAMSLIEENGGLGMLGIMLYWNRVPKSERGRARSSSISTAGTSCRAPRRAGRSTTTTTSTRRS